MTDTILHSSLSKNLYFVLFKAQHTIVLKQQFIFGREINENPVPQYMNLIKLLSHMAIMLFFNMII
jgi:hypothetical protein